MAWTSVSNIKGGNYTQSEMSAYAHARIEHRCKMEELANKMSAEMDRARRDLEKAKRGVKELERTLDSRRGAKGPPGVKGPAGITGYEIRVNRAFNGYNEEAIRLRAQEKLDKELKDKERSEVMAYYGDILTDQQKAALGYDLLLEEYRSEETREDRVRQYEMQQEAIRLRELADQAERMHRTKPRREQEETSFASQVMYELAYIRPA